MVCLLAGCEVRDPAGPGERTGDAARGSATIRTRTGIEMVLVPSGEFLMGDDNEDEERPAHRVRLGPFYMDATEVTQESFQKLMGRNPSKMVDAAKPVERVSWLLAIQYCNMRSQREGFKPCYDYHDPKVVKCDFTADGYRLPTEAEWEYACRAGTTGRWSFGDAPGESAKHGWFKVNSGKTTHPVRQKQPNPWGLYDMHGNVAEWCNDYYREGYGGDAPGENPRGPASGDKRVLRGGSFLTADEECRSSSRQGETPQFADACFGSEAYGFRCVRKADTNEPHPQE
jgi:formylglycine-generating enzyme